MDMITRESPWVSFRRLAKTGKTFAISASARIQPPRKIPKNTPQTARKKGPQWDPDRKEGNDGSGNGSQK